MDYDRAALATAYQDSGYLAVAGGFGQASMLTALTGHNVLLAFLRHMWNIAKAAGVDPARLPDSLYEQASTSFDWDTQQTGWS